MIQEMYSQFYGLVYNKLEPQLFLLFDYHKYGELGNNEIFSGMESWEPSEVPSFHPVRLDVHNSKCISTHCTWAKIVLIILLQTPFHVQNYRGLFDMLVNLSISNLTKMTMKSCLCHLFLIPIYNVSLINKKLTLRRSRSAWSLEVMVFIATFNNISVIWWLSVLSLQYISNLVSFC